MGESRQDLLNWLNQLLQLTINKVEQCGTGAAYCQVFDSIYMDLPMSRVKFNVNTEYAYLQNFKILQNAFLKHSVDRNIHVEQLVKCKMQDNLEFLQWLKRYWDQYFPGGDYDALARRKGAPGPAPTNNTVHAARTSNAAAAKRGTTPTTTAGPGVRTRTPHSAGPTSTALAQENATLKESVVCLEKERDFYFNKLRDVELLIQNAVAADPDGAENEEGFIKGIQEILYSTEEGFEIPIEGEEGDGDLETF